ncbi:ATP-binding cassette domain-containing protein [Paraconexibacter sp. AEG42_29]|uniref:ATP-binding cassette domain-containing protein n=1 Tax=Paraconexibacter sp. AEG42_29 TaxID=2997339 RepID=UPI00339D932F
MSTDLAIEATGLVKRFGDMTAVAGIDLSVRAGSVTAVLGPNGAGKTTMVRMLVTLSAPDEGRASVAGYDVMRDPTEVRRRIGFAAQDATVDELLTGRENLVMIGELYHLGRSRAKARADELLRQFSLVDAAERVVGKYSGGMRRRLDLAATLVATPDVLFLDEPTTGLDPRARNELWEVLDTLVESGVTILLTTQYLEEAERLADHILVVDQGRVIASGSARELKRQIGGEQIRAGLRDPARRADALRIVAEAAGAEATFDADGDAVVVATTGGAAAVAAVAGALADAGIEVDELALRAATLDEVFLELTGRSATDSASEEPAP